MYFFSAAVLLKGKVLFAKLFLLVESAIMSIGVAKMLFQKTEEVCKMIINKYDQQDLFDDFEAFDAQEKEGQEKVKKARELASVAHQGQTRDEGTPYFEHVNRVAQRLIDKNESSHSIVIAYLPDVLEDTNITYEELKEQFGKYVADGVSVLTKQKGADVKKYLQNIIEYKSSRIAYIKLFDRIDNISSLALCPDENKVRKYIKETKEIFIPVMSSGRQMEHHSYIELMNELEEQLAIVMDNSTTKFSE